MFQNKIDEVKKICKRNFSIIEKEIDSQISNANHVIYTLAISLLNDFATNNTKKIQEMVNIFDPQLKQTNFPPISGFKILGMNNEIIVHSCISSPNLLSEFEKTDSTYLKYIEKVKKHPFHLYVDPIRKSTRRKIEIIPIGMSIVGSNKNHIATILSGLSTAKINFNLNEYSSYFKNIKLLNPNALKKGGNPALTVKNLIFASIINKPIILYYNLANYPILVEAQLRVKEFNPELINLGLFCFQFFVLLSLLVYVFHTYNIKLISDIFNIINNKIKSVPSTKPNAKNLFNCIEKIFEDYQLLYLNHEEAKKKESAKNLKENILHLILTERHYHLHKKKLYDSVHHPLYISQLRNFINVNSQTEYLANYLSQIIGYCSEYFHELDICISKVKNDRFFSFKQAPLNEAIFNIFAQISRVGEFNTDSKILVKGYFTNDNQLPTIVIQASIIDSTILSSGWECGPNYIYSGLFAIYSLAKKNNLFFHIEQDGKVLSFILEPITEQKLETVMNCIYNSVTLDSKISKGHLG